MRKNNVSKLEHKKLPNKTQNFSYARKMLMSGWIVFPLLSVVEFSTSEEWIEAKPKSWDLLMFSQHWPITICTQWEEAGKRNKCTLPPKENLWTIHGIWPTHYGSEGPVFCNKSWHFNPHELEPILPDLELYWVNVEANTPLYSLWQHEWEKHGTCATSLPPLDSELKFFRKGLEWTQEYKMAGMLAKGSIQPRQDGYPVAAFYDSIRQSLGKKPIVECVVEKVTKASMVAEVRLCFDKDLTLIDCDYAKPKKDILTNCDLKKPIMYFDKVPAHLYGENERLDHHYLGRLHRVYNLIQYLIWFTI